MARSPRTSTRSPTPGRGRPPTRSSTPCRCSTCTASSSACSAHCGAAAVGRARLLVSGSAALTAVDHDRLHRLTGLAVRERYGLTETLILTAARADEPVEPGTVGRPLATTEVRLGPDEAGDDLGPVEVRGPSQLSG